MMEWIRAVIDDLHSYGPGSKLDEEFKAPIYLKQTHDEVGSMPIQ